MNREQKQNVEKILKRFFSLMIPILEKKKK